MGGLYWRVDGFESPPGAGPAFFVASTEEADPAPRFAASCAARPGLQTLTVVAGGGGPLGFRDPGHRRPLLL